MKTTKEEYQVISSIANRAIELKLHWCGDKISILMDIEFTHEIIPLDLSGLLSSEDFDFTHDIIGIHKNFNRTTKQMDNCFVPRYAK